MRIVRWEPQERVDIPDKTAENFLVLGEFRRTVRDLVLGEEANYLIRGFAVEPESPVSSRVVVKLDNSPSPHSLAIGAENLGSNIAYGQLIGGEDDNANLEGNAQQILDFSGQPNATYRVQMRFTYTAGVADNRAFWNPSTDAEFFQNVDTRHLPAYEIRFSGGASAEWIDLADVVWAGATISGGDITDLRDFLFEGVTPYQQTSQTGSGGAPDFSRSASRGDIAVGLGSLAPVLRAALRQIQDLKGPDDNGNWNWWGRPFQPFDPGAALTAGHTKHLRSLDTVTYVVGDGVTTFGDFNGANGLDDCLQHIEANEASFPNRIRILVRSLQTSAGSTTFALANQVTLNNKHLEIIGQAGGTSDRGQVKVNVTYNSGGEVIGLNGNSSIRMENIGMTGATSGAGVLLVQVDGGATGCILRNCTLLGETSAATTEFCLWLPTEGLEISNCEIGGRCVFAGIDDTPTINHGGVVRNTVFSDTAVELFAPGAPVGRAGLLRFEGCKFTGPSSVYTNQPLGCIQAGSSVSVTLYGCRVIYHPDTDGVHVEGASLLTLERCFLTTNGQSVSHGYNAGQNTTDGTGWAVYLGGAGRSITVRDCEVTHAESIDSGGVFIGGSNVHVNVEGLLVQDSGPVATAGGEFTGIHVVSGAQHVNIRNCHLFDWDPGGTDSVRGIYVNAAETLVEGCSIDGRDNVGTAINGTSFMKGMYVDGSGDRCRVVGCEFKFWRSGTASANDAFFLGGSSCIITGCTFRDNGGYGLDGNSSCDFTNMSGCTFISTDGNNLGADIDGVNSCVTGCVFNFSGGGARHGLRMQTNVADLQLAEGNMGSSGITQMAIQGTGTFRGHNEAQDVNVGFSYV